MIYGILIAGDEYRENWARAAGLLATVERVMATNLQKGNASLQKSIRNL